MKAIDWESFLPESAQVLFSSLELPDIERDELNSEVAEIQMPGGVNINVEWSDETNRYIVTPYRGHFETILAEYECDTVSEVIEKVKTCANAVTHKRINLSSSPANTSHKEWHPKLDNHEPQHA